MALCFYRHKVEKCSVLRKVTEMYREVNEPIRISHLCPEQTTKKFVAAATFHRLLCEYNSAYFG